jgi:hypothetical protein
MLNIELLVAAPKLPAMGASAQFQKSSKAHNENRLQALWTGRVTRLIAVPYLFPRMAGEVEVVYGSCGDFPPFEFWRTDGFGVELPQSHVQDAMGQAKTHTAARRRRDSHVKHPRRSSIAEKTLTGACPQEYREWAELRSPRRFSGK